jgi:hypothetical protein
MDATDGIGADAGCECVGYQAHKVVLKPDGTDGHRAH